MTGARWQCLGELFASALALDPSERAAFLEQRCPDDAELRTECARLLALDDEAERDHFLEPVAGQRLQYAGSDDRPALRGAREAPVPDPRSGIFPTP